MKPTQEQVIAWLSEATKTNGDVVRTALAIAYEAGRESMKYDGIHTCHDQCQRPACVAIREAVAAEREACAKVCDARADGALQAAEFAGASAVAAAEEAAECAAAIRARREQ